LEPCGIVTHPKAKNNATEWVNEAIPTAEKEGAKVVETEDSTFDPNRNPNGDDACSSIRLIVVGGP
jgi:hypothetical protein